MYLAFKDNAILCPFEIHDTDTREHEKSLFACKVEDILQVISCRSIYKVVD